jgi:hypothetical protein
MKLIIEIDVDASDFTEDDAAKFVEEAELATGLSVEVGRPISDEDLEVARMYTLGTEYFKCRVSQP